MDSISLAGSCFREELGEHQQQVHGNHHHHHHHFRRPMNDLDDNHSVNLSQYEVCELCSNGSSHGDASSTSGSSRCSSMVTSASTGAMSYSASAASFPLTGDSYYQYADELTEDQLEEEEDEDQLHIIARHRPHHYHLNKDIGRIVEADAGVTVWKRSPLPPSTGFLEPLVIYLFSHVADVRLSVWGQ